MMMIMAKSKKKIALLKKNDLQEEDDDEKEEEKEEEENDNDDIVDDVELQQQQQPTTTLPLVEEQQEQQQKCCCIISPQTYNNISNSKWVWMIGLAIFVVPAAIPDMELYRLRYSFYVLMIVCGLLGFFYMGIEALQRQRRRQQPETISLVDNNDANKRKEERAPEEEEEETSPPPRPPEKPTVVVVEQQQQQQAPPRTSSQPNRLYFLDNVKVWLTICVLLHHLFGGFGAEPGVVLKIGSALENSWWIKAWNYLFLGPNGLYFMSLFYFTSAYFCPSSLRRKGKITFIAQRTQRILLGAILATFLFFPLAIVWALTFVTFRDDGSNHNTFDDQEEEEGNNSIESSSSWKSIYKYRPAAGATWFLWWLFLFNLWYASTTATTTTTTTTTTTVDDNNNNNNPLLPTNLPLSKYFTKFPSKFYWRWIFAILLGYVNLITKEVLFSGASSFASMPNDYNGFSSYLVFFYMGLVAGENQWFSRSSNSGDSFFIPLRQQLGMNVWLFRLFVVLIYLVMVLSRYQIINVESFPMYGQFLIMGAILGLWVVEFSVAVLEFFQTNLNYTNVLWSFLARWSYGAYLLQNILICTTPVAIFVYTYNASNPQYPIVFEQSTTSATPIPLVTLIVMGWIYGAIVYLPMCYLVAYGLGQLPLFKRIL